MHYTVKTLLEQGRGHRAIARELGVSRKTVRRIARDLESGTGPGRYARDRYTLDAYRDQIAALLGQGLTAVLVHERLVRDHGLSVSYATVRRMVAELKGSEVFVPMECAPGEEAQVDFGYFGRFDAGGRSVRVWVFAMVLSHSRLAYYEEVTDQRIPTFLACHQRAFAFFGGAPRTVKIDNLRAGVAQADPYEPRIQAQYAEMLAHYGSAVVTSRVRRPQDKGKVEAGVKYVKRNFLRGLGHRDLGRLPGDLRGWTAEKANLRRHGTTRKVPREVFDSVEREALLPLPARGFEVLHIQQRKVNRMAHVHFGGNYYSVPYTLAGQAVEVRAGGSLLRVLCEGREQALHELAEGRGRYVTLEHHKPPGKRHKDPDHYRDRLAAIGPSALAMLEALLAHDPRHWRDKARGILGLARHWPPPLVELACRRALHYRHHGYLPVRNILERGLAGLPPPGPKSPSLGGNGHDLRIYDQLAP